MAHWKVYREEWTIGYASLARGEAGRQEAQAYLDEHCGYIDPSKVTLQASSPEPQDWPWYVLVRKPVLKAHFSNEQRAVDYAEAVEGTIVEADSEDEDALGSLQ